MWIKKHMSWLADCQVSLFLQTWSPGPILGAKNGLPGPILAAKNGPPLPTAVLAGPNLATKLGPGVHFWQLKVVRWTKS